MFSLPADIAVSDTQRAFLQKTYGHLIAAIAAFIGLEFFFFNIGLDMKALALVQKVNWLWILGAYMLVSWMASRAAHTIQSKSGQYLALAAYIAAEALLFLPMFAIAIYRGHEAAIQQAAVVSLVAFSILTAIVFITKKDFSFLRTALMWGGILALLAIVSGGIFGFQLGNFFSIAMIALAGGSILYDTSNILNDFPQDRYIGASLQLFASVALLFWYVLRLFMSRD